MAKSSGVQRKDTVTKPDLKARKTAKAMPRKQPRPNEMMSLFGQLAKPVQNEVQRVIADWAAADNAIGVDQATQAFERTHLGKVLSPSERAELRLSALRSQFEIRQRLLQDSLTATQVSHLLQVSRQTPHDRTAAGTLLGVQDQGIWKFPFWQFDPFGPDGVIDGLPDVLRALTCSDFEKIAWLISPNRELNGQTPLNLLKAKKREPVIAEAETVGFGQ